MTDIKRSARALRSPGVACAGEALGQLRYDRVFTDSRSRQADADTARNSPSENYPVNSNAIPRDIRSPRPRHRRNCADAIRAFVSRSAAGQAAAHSARARRDRSVRIVAARQSAWHRRYDGTLRIRLAIRATDVGAKARRVGPRRQAEADRNLCVRTRRRYASGRQRRRCGAARGHIRNAELQEQACPGHGPFRRFASSGCRRGSMFTG